MTWDAFNKITENLAALYAQNFLEELEDANRTQPANGGTSRRRKLS
jgi:hypothetical protein